MRNCRKWSNTTMAISAWITFRYTYQCTLHHLGGTKWWIQIIRSRWSGSKMGRKEKVCCKKYKSEFSFAQLYWVEISCLFFSLKFGNFKDLKTRFSWISIFYPFPVNQTWTMISLVVLCDTTTTKTSWQRLQHQFYRSIFKNFLNFIKDFVTFKIFVYHAFSGIISLYEIFSFLPKDFVYRKSKWPAIFKKFSDIQNN